MVLAEDSTGLETFTLTDNSSAYRRLLAESLDQSEGQSPTGVTSVNGKNAVQYEIRGVVDNQPMVYLHTTIVGESSYYQVIGWTKAENYDTRRTELQTVIESFRAP